MIKAVFSPERFTGWHMLGVLCLFFGTIIAVNGVLAVMAAGTWTGLVVKNSYVASQEWNDKLAAADRQAERGWRGALDYRGGVLTLSLTDAEGAPVAADRIAAVVGRPTFEQLDHDVVFERGADGLYRGATALADGLWEVDLRVAQAGQEEWRQIHRFTVQEGVRQ